MPSVRWKLRHGNWSRAKCLIAIDRALVRKHAIRAKRLRAQNRIRKRDLERENKRLRSKLKKLENQRRLCGGYIRDLEDKIKELQAERAYWNEHQHRH